MNQYTIRIDPPRQLIEAEALFDGLSKDAPLRLAVPTWVPGAYAFMRYGRDFVDVTARDAVTGRALSVRREGLSGFEVEAGAKKVEVRWRAFTSDPAWGELTGVIDTERAVLLGTRYLFRPDAPGPCEVRYEVPEGWAIHHPDGAEQLAPSRWRYPSFALWMDTPVVCGKFDVRTRALDGVEFHHVFLDRAVGFEREVEGFIDDLMKIAERCKAIFGSFPFAHYTWVFSFDPKATWGLEHASATMIGLGENALIDPIERARGLRVSAHELFHAWNVCRLKPAPFGKLDPVQGSFTEGLWVAEGFTRYYEFLLGVRAGFITPRDFFSNVANYYRHLVALPAYRRASPADSSYATFLNHHRYPGSANSSIDYYDAGMLIAFDLDAHLRLGGAAPHSLDTAFCAFFEEYVGRGDGFTTEEAIRFLGGRVEGGEALLRREVLEPGGLSTLAQLERLGFEVEQERFGAIGIILEKDRGPKVLSALDDGPAARAGLQADDVLLKVAGFPFELTALKWVLAHEERVSFEVQRGHRFVTLDVPVERRNRVASLKWQGTDDQLRLLAAWFQQPELSLHPGERLALSSHENFHGIKTVL